MQSRSTRVGLVAAFLLVAGSLPAQIDVRERRLPLGPNRPSGEAVAPFLEGWYANADDSNTASRKTKKAADISL